MLNIQISNLSIMGEVNYLVGGLHSLSALAVRGVTSSVEC